jgi:inhibitor of KinA
LSLTVPYLIFPLGDQALTIELGDKIDPSINKKCVLLAKHLHQLNIKGVKDIVPAYTTVSVLYDPFMLPSSAYNFIKAEIEKAINTCNWNELTNSRKIKIPVCYHSSLASDIDELASSKNISAEEVVQLHSSQSYYVYVIGFLPGFAYMGTVDEKIAAPRKQQPHLNINAGSIGIAGFQTGIYPLNSPGGWNIIGQTPLKMFDVSKDQPCYLQQGDEVKFMPISLEEFNHLKQKS